MLADIYILLKPQWSNLRYRGGQKIVAFLSIGSNMQPFCTSGHILISYITEGVLHQLSKAKHLYNTCNITVHAVLRNIRLACLQSSATALFIPLRLRVDLLELEALIMNIGGKTCIKKFHL